jgi:hypothetical protein
MRLCCEAHLCTTVKRIHVPPAEQRRESTHSIGARFQSLFGPSLAIFSTFSGTKVAGAQRMRRFLLAQNHEIEHDLFEFSSKRKDKHAEQSRYTDEVHTLI